MARRAVLRFKPIDYAYQEEYGIMPDYDFTDRLRAGEDAEAVSRLIEERMAAVWAKMKAEHEGTYWTAAGSDCPF